MLANIYAIDIGACAIKSNLYLANPQLSHENHNLDSLAPERILPLSSEQFGPIAIQIGVSDASHFAT
jgi:hypothetical protein